MDNQRVFIWAALALVLYLNFMAWQKDYAPPPVPASTTQTQSENGAEPAANDTLPELPSSDATAPPASASGTSAATIDQSNSETIAGTAPVIRVLTDVFLMDISTRGGELIRADLLKYPVQKNRPDDPVQLFRPTPPLYVARSGLRAADNRAEPTHQVTYQAASNEYKLEAGQEELLVPLTWTDGEGVTVTKTFRFKPGSYQVDLSYDVENQSGAEYKAASYVQLIRHYEHIERSYFKVETYAYRGPAIYDGKRYLKLDIEDAEDRVFRDAFAGGWMASLQHHFVAAAVPPVDETYDYQLNLVSGNDYVLSYRGPLAAVPAGGKHTFNETLFVGPKLQEQLAQAGPRLELVADYGKLTILSQPLFTVLEFVYGVVGNWGWAIIIVTFLIKLAFYKLTASSGRSMAKMRNLGPRIKAIQERYKDDREQLGRKMMEIYKSEKINPLAGCLPILIQIPFFLAFYWVLLESVEMRQAPFLGWITDLSSRDPYFILPILMAGAMFAQFRLQPMPSTDPMQAKIFMFMPIIMSVTMAWFPAGLVLYWLTNTLLSIAQQWRINKLVAMEDKKDKDRS